VKAGPAGRSARGAISKPPSGRVAICAALALCLGGCARVGFVTLDAGTAADGGSQTTADADAGASGDPAGPTVHGFFLRSDGLGDDSADGLSPATALASLQGFFDAIDLAREAEGLQVYQLRLAATAGELAYAPASHTGPVRQDFHIIISGGHLFRHGHDLGPRGMSRIAAPEIAGLEPGVLIDYGRGSDHGASATVEVSRVRFDGVRTAVEIKASASLDSVRPRLVLDRVEIVSTGHGVYVDYPKNYSSHGPSRVELRDVSILAGTGRVGEPAHGVYVNGVMPRVEIADSSISSRWGDGVHITQRAENGPPDAPDAFYLDLRRTTVSGCAGHGVTWQDRGPGVMYRARGLRVSLRQTRLEANAGSGLSVLMRPQHNDGSDHSQLSFEAYNLLVADNGGDGVRIVAETDAPSASSGLAAVHALLVSSSIVNNPNGCGFCSSSGHEVGGEHSMFNTLLADNRVGVEIADADLEGMSLLENYNAFFDLPEGELLVNGAAMTPGIADLFEDPLLSGLAPDPFRPSAGSPLLDAGLQAFAPDQDLLGEPRPQGAEAAIGAYETTAP